MANISVNRSNDISNKAVNGNKLKKLPSNKNVFNSMKTKTRECKTAIDAKNLNNTVNSANKTSSVQKFQYYDKSNEEPYLESRQKINNTIKSVPKLVSDRTLRRKRSLSINSTVERVNKTENNEDELCIHPEYLVFTWVLCLVALATTLKLYFLIKTLLAVAMVTVYSVLLIIIYPEVFLLPQLDEK